MLGSWAASRFLGSLVLGAPAQNFTTLAAAALAVIAVAMIAAAIPIWRATRVDVINKLHRA
jgi:ABC-type antimicrobial peptide transport system permease subunit